MQKSTAQLEFKPWLGSPVYSVHLKTAKRGYDEFGTWEGHSVENDGSMMLND
ncbi:hypothetical protein [Paenibacillus sp. FSL K6-2859]|uniref:hypothetical protein n=1 Tax=Paenibacillus sp. FSL K6-2859 TaxID=2921482 RepID=UPI0030F520B4